MKIVLVKTFSEINVAFEDGADVVLHEVKHAPVVGYISHYCHVMVRSDDHTRMIRESGFGWSSSNATDGYLIFTVLPEGADEVIADRVEEALESLPLE